MGADCLGVGGQDLRQRLGHHRGLLAVDLHAGEALGELREKLFRGQRLLMLPPDIPVLLDFALRHLQARSQLPELSLGGLTGHRSEGLRLFHAPLDLALGQADRAQRRLDGTLRVPDGRGLDAPELLGRLHGQGRGQEADLVGLVFSGGHLLLEARQQALQLLGVLGLFVDLVCRRRLGQALPRRHRHPVLLRRGGHWRRRHSKGLGLRLGADLGGHLADPGLAVITAEVGQLLLHEARNPRHCRRLSRALRAALKPGAASAKCH
mmetsp:Transcript_80300/g.231972  ORF Transcript_80300/g.231972 Transcript_80300/m.231972 type:complete len:265 (+) Transcript_80300:2992-3786(+)